MNKLILILVSFLLSFGFVTHSEGQALSKEQKEIIKNQVDSNFKEMLFFAEKLDYDKLSSGVDNSRRAGFITNRKYYTDYSFLIDDIKMNAQGVSQQSISIKEKKVTVLSDNIALLTVSGVSKANLNDGREVIVNFHWSFVYEKIDNNWKVIHSHQSTTAR